MTRIIIHGCNGKMGQVVSSLAAADEKIEVAAGIDIADQGANPYPVFRTLEECGAEADVVVDFSYAGAVDGLLDACAAKKLPVVVCTTGLSEEQLAHLSETAKSVPVLKSANMSVGINLLMKILEPVAQTLAEAGFDIEIVEKHHNQKVDAPSGTALALADTINESLGGEYAYRYDRSSVREKRPVKEIGLSAVRGGTIVGDHEVIFAGADEVITFKHTAYSKAIFAKGALEAAKYLNGCPAGLYDMSDVIG